MSIENRSIPVAVAVGRAGVENGTSDHATKYESYLDQRTYHTPLIDIHEGPEGLILEADLPGATDNQVGIQLEENVLSLYAKVSTSAPEGARILHEEYQVGDFHRSFILSDEVERGKITAELKNGVLRLMLPKAERAKTRRIEIKS